MLLKFYAFVDYIHTKTFLLSRQVQMLGQMPGQMLGQMPLEVPIQALGAQPIVGQVSRHFRLQSILTVGGADRQ